MLVCIEQNRSVAKFSFLNYLWSLTNPVHRARLVHLDSIFTTIASSPSMPPVTRGRARVAISEPALQRQRRVAVGSSDDPC